MLVNFFYTFKKYTFKVWNLLHKNIKLSIVKDLWLTNLCILKLLFHRLRLDLILNYSKLILKFTRYPINRKKMKTSTNCSVKNRHHKLRNYENILINKWKRAIYFYAWALYKHTRNYRGYYKKCIQKLTLYISNYIKHLLPLLVFMDFIAICNENR